MRKKMALILTLALLLACVPTSALASGANRTDYVNVDIETASRSVIEEIAHLDIGVASRSLQEKIIQARDVIIFSTSSWVADEYADDFPDTPKFSDLFPSWDLPKVKTENSSSSRNMVMVTSPTSIICSIPAATSGTAKMIGTLYPTKAIKMKATASSMGCSTVNIGFSADGEVKHYEMSLGLKVSTKEYTLTGTVVGVHVSTLDTPNADGGANIVVNFRY